MLKSTGIVRRVDEVGRIVLPVEMRRLCGIAEMSPLEISLHGDQIVLRRYQPLCIFCGQKNGATLLHGKPICVDCQACLSQAAGD